MFLMVFIAGSFRLFPFDIYRIARNGKTYIQISVIHGIDTNMARLPAWRIAIQNDGATATLDENQKANLGD